MKNKFIVSPYLIIGSGRLGRHLQHYFNLLGVSFTSWNRSQNLALLDEFLSHKPLVLLAISDHALADFFETHLANRKIDTVHFSGAFHNPRIFSCHPLMTFSEELYSLEVYKSIYFAVTGFKKIQDILPELPNQCFTLNENDKAFYHAWCVLTAAGTQKIWKTALNQLRSRGVPEKALQTYIHQISENFLTNPKSSLTGPWPRNDQVTIQKNLEALSQTQAAQIYELLMKGNL